MRERANSGASFVSAFSTGSLRPPSSADRKTRCFFFARRKIDGREESRNAEMRLWIIGNGFDLYHGLKTRYMDYKAFLCRQNTCRRKNAEINPEYLPLEACRNCGIETRQKSCPVRRFEDLPRSQTKDSLWCDLEEACSIDLTMLFQLVRSFPNCGDGSAKQNPATGILDDYLSFARLFTGNLFFKWLNDVKIKDAKKRSCLGIDSNNDVFLTFNYTRTLQEVYKIEGDRVCYIRGDVISAKSEIAKAKHVGDADFLAHKCLIFGSPDLTITAVQDAVKNYAQSIGLRDRQNKEMAKRLFALTKSLAKDVNCNLKRMMEFIIEKCSDPSELDEVVVAGHSLGRIDRPYFNLLATYFKCKQWRFLFHCEEDVERAFEFCKEHKINGCCVPWECAVKSFRGGVPCQKHHGITTSGFSIFWPNQK